MLHPRPDLRRAVRPRSIAVICLSGQVACVLPGDRATGIELRWRLAEANTADAEVEATDPADPAEPRLRTCAGARVGRVEAELRDLDDPARVRSFSHACEVGNPAPAERLGEPAEIFVDLRAGRYALDLRWFAAADGPALELGRATQTVQVEADGVVPVDPLLQGPLVTWTLDLRGTAACDRLTLEIVYADPEAALFEPVDRYRERLTSAQGLTTGAPVACSDLADGLQVFPDLDRGAYRLQLAVDGRACARDFLVDPGAAPLAVDLAKPGCAG